MHMRERENTSIRICLLQTRVKIKSIRQTKHPGVEVLRRTRKYWGITSGWCFVFIFCLDWENDEPSEVMWEKLKTKFLTKSESSKDAFYLAEKSKYSWRWSSFLEDWKLSQKSGVVNLLSKLPFGRSPPLSQGLWEVWPLEPQLLLTLPASEPPLA